MNICVLYTKAYNAKKTITRAIESVLAQTQQNWIWYLLDNGATDGTGEIVKHYAAKDSRIIPLKNQENNVFEKGNRLIEDIIKMYDNSDYSWRLDADDEYKPDFLQKMLHFALEYNLDVAVCGHDFIDESSGKLSGTRVLTNNLILDTPEKFSMYFPVYHQFSRTNWCKLIKISVMNKFDFEGVPKLLYGGDTVFAQEIFRHANRVGILAESLHKYYMSPKSSSYYLDEKRLECDRILDDFTRQFLIDKCSFISPQNDEFLQKIYFHAIQDTLNVLLNSQVRISDKLEGLYDIFTCENTQRLIAWPGCKEEKQQLFKSLSDWILSQSECRKLVGVERTVGILVAINKDLLQWLKKEDLKYLLLNIPDIVKYVIQKHYNQVIERLQTWYKRHTADDLILTKLEIAMYCVANKPYDELFDLLIDIKKNRPQASDELKIDNQIKELTEKYPLLQGVSIKLMVTLTHTIRWIIKENYIRALEKFISVSQNVEITDEDIEAYLLLGQNISAAADNVDAYVYFKKVWVSYLLDCSRNEEARKEINDFEQLLPDDDDFAELRKRLN